MTGVYRRADGVLSEVIGDKAALVNPEGTELLTLNPVGSIVWEALPEAGKVEELVACVTAACENVPAAQVAADVSGFLDELQRLGLIVADDEPVA
jgi:hypothetical protein